MLGPGPSGRGGGHHEGQRGEGTRRDGVFSSDAELQPNVLNNIYYSSVSELLEIRDVESRCVWSLFFQVCIPYLFSFELNQRIQNYLFQIQL